MVAQRAQRSRIIPFSLIVILVPGVLLLGSTLRLFTNFSFYQKLYKETGVYETFSSQNIVNNATENLFAYYHNKASLDANFFSNQARMHLADVKAQYLFLQRLFLLFTATVIILSFWLIKNREQRRLLKAFMLASGITLAFTTLAFSGILANFDELFIKFHELLFTNNLWLLPDNDTLIKLFPGSFFVVFAKAIVVKTAAIALTMLLCCGIMYQIHYRKQQ